LAFIVSGVVTNDMDNSSENVAQVGNLRYVFIVSGQGAI
jgi:hypothetical protein